MYWGIKCESIQVGWEKSERREYVLWGQCQYFQFPEKWSTWGPLSRSCHNPNYSFLMVENSGIWDHIPWQCKSKRSKSF